MSFFSLNLFILMNFDVCSDSAFTNADTLNINWERLTCILVDYVNFDFSHCFSAPTAVQCPQHRQSILPQGKHEAAQPSSACLTSREL